jgi:hypothetical protein
MIPARACSCRQPFSDGDGCCVYCGRDLPEPACGPASAAPPRLRLSKSASADARRILDGVARRLLAARDDGQAIGPASGGDGRLGDGGADERTALVVCE